MNGNVYNKFKYWFVVITSLGIIALNFWTIIQPFDSSFSIGLWVVVALFIPYIGFLVYLLRLRLDTKYFNEIKENYLE